MDVGFIASPAQKSMSRGPVFFSWKNNVPEQEMFMIIITFLIIFGIYS